VVYNIAGIANELSLLPWGIKGAAPTHIKQKCDWSALFNCLIIVHGKKGSETMAEKEVILTFEGLAKLEGELEHLKTVRRREVAERIKQALEFGDISENSEYDDAKNEQAFIEGRILTIEKMLRNARVIDEEEKGKSNGVVRVGSKVKVKDLEDNEESEYVIVGSAEADPLASKISNESPVGKALLGQKVGTIIEVKVPAGVVNYEIIAID
jgi:transcription elongation factor GreA